ncbi:hypothetical protein [Candidatus Methanomassiliicoccus intestinalis]|jgi:sigma-70, region 4|uniref:Uncharacterized protein n=1 Tax=Candidatus Methanomassiliicoccus intestinalis TaxID=1406512 RepID=A0A8J8PGR2_9ARCH|nr:MAG: hypothetical protein A3207_08155 [Candidatus Methanomassiliicoccus intestinalis]
MNNVDDCNNSTADEKNAREKNISEIGAGLVETFLNIGMTEEELRIFICKEKGMSDEDIAIELNISETSVKNRLYEAYQGFHLHFKSVNTSEKELLVTLPTTLVKWMDEEIEMRGYESRDELIRWVLHHHYNELRYGIKIECNDPDITDL